MLLWQSCYKIIIIHNDLHTRPASLTDSSPLLVELTADNTNLKKNNRKCNNINISEWKQKKEQTNKQRERSLERKKIRKRERNEGRTEGRKEGRNLGGKKGKMDGKNQGRKKGRNGMEVGR